MAGSKIDRSPLPPATRPPHSERYWSLMKYVIIGLAVVMVIILLLTGLVLLRVVS